MGREDQLPLESQHVERGRSIGGVERAKGLNFLGGFDQPVAQPNQIGAMGVAVAPALGDDDGDLLVGDQGGGIAHLPDLIP